MALESLDLVVGVDHHRRMKFRRRRNYSPPPHHFSVVVAGRDLLGFEEEVETNQTQPVSAPEVVGNAATNSGHRPRSVATVYRQKGCRDAMKTGKRSLGFVELGKTKRMAQVWGHLVAGAERKLRSKFSAAAAVNAAVRRRQPPNHRRTTTRWKSLKRRFKPHWTRRHSSPETPSTAGQSCRVCLGRR